MKRLIAAVALLAISAPAVAQVHVRGYYKKDGTYVQAHERSSPNDTTSDNYSTRGNVNPYTGQPGTKDPYQTPTYRPSTPSYTPTTPSYQPPTTPSPYKAPCYYNCSK
jgi:hypothetical protein